MKKSFKKVMAILMALLLCVGSVSWNTFTVKAVSLASKQPDAGVGTETSPYEIDEASELLWFAETVNGGNTTIYGVLTADIDVNPGYTFAEDGTYTADESAGELVTWTPIGNYSLCNGFDGSFDGQNHIISGLYAVDSGKNYVGLFGRLKPGGEILNVKVNDSYIEGCMFVGGVCGGNYSNSDSDAVIRNCSNTGTVKGCFGVGGVCGDTSGPISNCHNEGKILLGSCAYRRGFGGVCGIHRGGAISKCSNEGTITGYTDVGGVCGLAWGAVIIENSYNIGEISGDSRVGGIAGDTYDSSCTLTVENSYNVGGISGESYIGEIVGLGGTVSNCYYLSESESDSVEGTTYKTSTQFASGEVTILLNGNSSDYENETSPAVWYQNIDDGANKDSYPVLDSTSGKVYGGYNGCILQGTNLYPNDLAVEKTHGEYSNGYCTACGEIQAAIETTDKYDMDGDGVTDVTYEIDNAGQLYWFASYVNEGNSVVHAVLTNNIVVNEKVYENGTVVTDATSLKAWTPIGNKTTQYEGIFDGQNYSVKGLYFNDSTVEYVGLFGYADNATISSVGVVDSYFYGKTYVGGVVGYIYYANILNCYNTGRVESSGMYIGGICGQNEYGTIENCYNWGNIKSTSYYAGGICGYMRATNDRGAIQTCYSIGDITASYTAYAGGILGYTTAAVKSYIKNCYYLSGLGNSGTYGGTAYSKELFTSGAVAYLLQTAQTGTEIVWGQLIGEDTYPVLGGAQVYNVENCNAGQYSNVHESKAHNFSDGVCVVCGKIVDVILSGYTLSLEGNIAVNFYLQLSEEVLSDETAHMLFSFADGETSKVKVSEAETKTDGSKTYHVMTCRVQAPEMNDDFTAQLITDVCETEVFTYSVKKYADYILSHTEDDEEYADAAPMVKAMLNYGGYVQKQFGHNTGALANAGLYTESNDPVLVGSVPALSSYAFTAPSANIGVKYYGTSLLLNSETTIRHYFTFTTGDDIETIRKNYEFKLDDETILTPVMRGGMIYIDIKDINAADLDTMYQVTVTNIETNESITFSYSALSYAKYVLDYALAGTNLVNVVRAMYFYNDAANAYFG